MSNADDVRATQTHQIYQHLKKGRTITGLQALYDFGVMRLPARIFDLRERGVLIRDSWVRVGSKRVKMYWLETQRS